MFISHLDRLNGIPKIVECEKHHLIGRLLIHKETFDKHACDLWVPAWFPVGERRLIENCLGVSALVFDLDHGPGGAKDPVRFEDVQDVTNRLRADGLEHLILSSYRFLMGASATNPTDIGLGFRTRFVVFMTKHVVPGVKGMRWKAFCRAAAGRWCPLADPATFDCVHPYFYPACPPGAPRVAIHVQGRELDPDEILSTLTDAAISDPTSIQVDPFRGASRRDLEELARGWARQARYNPQKGAMLATLRALIKGERLAEDGAKERTIANLCFAIVKEIPYVTTESLADLFAPSLAIMGVDPAEYRPSVVDRIERGRTYAAKSHLAQREETKHGRPIAQDAQGWVYFKQGGRYEGPYRRIVFREAFKERFHDEIGRGEIRLEDLDGKPLTDSAVLDRYGQTVTAIKYEVGRPEDEIADRVLWLGCANHRVEASRNETCETFLRIICGATPDGRTPLELVRGEKVLADVKLWLAVAKLHPMEPLPALQLIGEAGVGKSTFAWAVARLWHDGPPIKASEAFGQFNARLKDCPFIFADEGIPTSRQGQLTFTQRFRELLTSTSLDIEAKGQMPTTVKGAPRIWFAVNEAEDLATNEAYGAGTIKALADRYYRLPNMGPEVLKQVIALGDAGKEEIIRCMAGHVMWLASYEVKLEKRGRFWIEGDRDEIVSELKTSGGLRDSVLQWIAAWVFDPSKASQFGKPLHSRVTDDWRIFLASNEIVDLWTAYFPNARTTPATRSIGQALRGLAVATARTGAGDMNGASNGGNRRLHELDLAALRRWCVASGRATPEELDQQIRHVVTMREHAAKKAAQRGN